MNAIGIVCMWDINLVTKMEKKETKRSKYNFATRIYSSTCYLGLPNIKHATFEIQSKSSKG